MEQNNERKNMLQQYKVADGTIKSPVEIALERDIIRLDKMLKRELNSKEDAYENIIEMQRFLSYPHSQIPNAQDKVYEKLYAIQNILGKDVLDKGLEIYENDKGLYEMNAVLSLEDRIRIEQQINQDINLAQKLTYYRYHPEISKNYSGEITKYMAVFSKMVEKSRESSYEEKEPSVR